VHKSNVVKTLILIDIRDTYSHCLWEKKHSEFDVTIVSEVLTVAQMHSIKNPYTGSVIQSYLGDLSGILYQQYYLNTRRLPDNILLQNLSQQQLIFLNELFHLNAIL